MYKTGQTHQRVTEIKALSLFQGNPKSWDEEPDFWNSFTKQTQQFLCTNNTELKGLETKKAKNEQRNIHNYHAPAIK